MVKQGPRKKMEPARMECCLCILSAGQNSQNTHLSSRKGQGQGVWSGVGGGEHLQGCKETFTGDLRGPARVAAVSWVNARCSSAAASLTLGKARHQRSTRFRPHKRMQWKPRVSAQIHSYFKNKRLVAILRDDHIASRGGKQICRGQRIDKRHELAHTSLEIIFLKN